MKWFQTGPSGPICCSCCCCWCCFFSFLFCERQIKIIVWSSPVLRLRARPLQTQVATSCDFLQHATVHELGTINITTSCHGIRIIRCISRYIPIYIFLSLSLVTYTLVWHATQKSVSLIIIIVSFLHYTVYILYSSRYKLSHTIAYLPYLPLDFFCSFFSFAKWRIPTSSQSQLQSQSSFGR